MPNRLSTLEKTVREHFGLSQADLASHLGVSRSALNMAERMERDLRAEPSAKLIAWLPLVQAADLPPPASVSPATGSAARAALEVRLDRCRHEAGQLRYALKPLEKRALQARRRQQALSVLQNAVPAGPAGERSRAWLQRFASGTALLAEAEDQATLLRLRLRALEFEIAEAERWLAAVPDAAP